MPGFTNIQVSARDPKGDGIQCEWVREESQWGGGCYAESR